jgi:hypothetical protein
MTAGAPFSELPGMTKTPPPVPAADAVPRWFFFDRRDHELIRIINEISSHDHTLDYVRRRYYGYFHPHGIKEMAEWRSLRIAYAMVRLLTSLEIGAMEDRLSALSSLRAEVLDTAEGPLPKNTARALMQIMKEVVRTRDDPLRQLQLAHDFRITASGKPRVVRRQLRNYHLLEMPEAWNQLAFDDHVHDANTKGRKSSTHLIMDAWIKGIRRLRVVHYNFIEPRTAAELMEAASIMDIDVRIGIEFYAPFRDKYINLIWAPRGFPDAQAFLCFLEEPAVVALMGEGRRVSEYQQIFVMKLLEAFNRRHRLELNRRFEIEVEPLDPKEFLRFVGMGQKSTLHLEKFIQEKMLAAMHRRAGHLRTACRSSDPKEKKRIEAWFEEMDRLDLDGVVTACLKPANNSDIPDHTAPRDDPDVPALLRRSPSELLCRLAALQSGYRITLNLSNLVVEDVLELLYDSNGMITRLELFNLKDWANGRTEHIPAISRLQETINSRNPIKLKRVILESIQRTAEGESEYKTERIAKLKTILHDIISLQAMYKGKMLKARMGSDSTGRTPRFHGMGLAVIDTLPLRARYQIHKDIGSGRDRIPIHISVQKNYTFMPASDEHQSKPSAACSRVLSALRAIWPWPSTRRLIWSIHIPGTRMERPGNIITLGGVQQTIRNELSLSPGPQRNHRGRIPLRYVNSNLRNLFKVLAGFVPAFATFFLTKDWWLLAYMGAFIWFAITGVRNILQSVLGGGGLRRSPLLRWNAYVSWDRIADSLLFTGFSVPLLDYLTKTVLLDRLFGITTSTAPILLYTVMALVNGIYICTHNAFRGLPRAAIYGNFFRSALSIPIAIGINFVAGQFLVAAGTVAAAPVLQKWAAIISKTASDLVAGIIEGAADRGSNIRIRFREYRKKLAELLDIYAQLELLYPETNSYELLEAPRNPRTGANIEARDLEKIITIHALDLLYFWMYQPRARSALDQLLRTINEEERHLLITSQFTLLRQREISQMFIDGILGNDFARALSFYLSRFPDYLEAMKRYV